MIQRVQTVYLLIITILGVVTLFLPIFGVSTLDTNTSSIRLFDLFGNFPLPLGGWIVLLPIVAILIPIVSVATIFLYKNRRLQLNLAKWLLVAIVLFYILVALVLIISYMELAKILPADDSVVYSMDLKIGAFCLILGLVFNVFAILAIRHDENLVRSLNRIR